MRAIAPAIIAASVILSGTLAFVGRWKIAPLSVETNSADTETVARFLRLDRWSGEVQFCRHTVSEASPNPRTTCSTAEPSMRRPS